MVRTRSLAAHEKALEAATALFAERGFDLTSMDAISEASGVSKATLYKHWADKEALILEVMEHLHGLHVPPPPFDSGDSRQDLIDLLSYDPGRHHVELKMRMLPHFWAYSARNPKLGDTFRDRIMRPGRGRMAEILKRAQAQGELVKKLDVELSIALLYGPVIFRHIFYRHQLKQYHNLPELVVNAFWEAHCVRATSPARLREA